MRPDPKRAAFESWWRQTHDGGALQKQDADGYIDERASVAWAAWQAAIEQRTANIARALQLAAQHHKRAHAEVLRLAERLRKYEPGKPMMLSSEPP